VRQEARESRAEVHGRPRDLEGDLIRGLRFECERGRQLDARISLRLAFYGKGSLFFYTIVVASRALSAGSPTGLIGESRGWQSLAALQTYLEFPRAKVSSLRRELGTRHSVAILSPRASGLYRRRRWSIRSLGGSRAGAARQGLPRWHSTVHHTTIPAFQARPEVERQQRIRDD